jgi:hypothetical protein
MTVGITLAGGGTAAMPESMLTGGTLGGLLAFRSESLDPAQNALGRIAIGLAETFNAQHRLGQDLTGALGGDFFTRRRRRWCIRTARLNGGTAPSSAAVAARRPDHQRLPADRRRRRQLHADPAVGQHDGLRRRGAAADRRRPDHQPRPPARRTPATASSSSRPHAPPATSPWR